MQHSPLHFTDPCPLRLPCHPSSLPAFTLHLLYVYLPADYALRRITPNTVPLSFFPPSPLTPYLPSPLTLHLPLPSTSTAFALHPIESKRRFAANCSWLSSWWLTSRLCWPAFAISISGICTHSHVTAITIMDAMHAMTAIVASMKNAMALHAAMWAARICCVIAMAGKEGETSSARKKENKEVRAEAWNQETLTEYSFMMNSPLICGLSALAAPHGL